MPPMSTAVILLKYVFCLNRKFHKGLTMWLLAVEALRCFFSCSSFIVCVDYVFRQKNHRIRAKRNKDQGNKIKIDKN